MRSNYNQQAGRGHIYDPYEDASVHKLDSPQTVVAKGKGSPRTPNALLAGLALGGALLAGGTTYAFTRHTNTAPSKAHAALIVPGNGTRAEATPIANIEQEFTLSPLEFKSPDGHSVLITASPKSNPKEQDLFLSTDNGKDATLVVKNVDAVTWSPYVEQGQDPLFAVLEHDGTDSQEQAVVYRVNPDGGAQAVASDDSTMATRLEFSYDGKTQTKMYDWQRNGNQVEFTANVPMGGQNPDGATWVGGIQNVDLHMTI